MRICIFGDSIVHGVMDAEKGGWANRLMCYFQEHWDAYEASVYALGIDAETAAGLLKRFQVEADARKPDVIVFAIGINDSAHWQDGRECCLQEDFVCDIDALVALAKKYTSTIVFVGLTRVNEQQSSDYQASDDWVYTNTRIALFDTLLQEAAERAGGHYISCATIVPIENLPDRLHPDATGHQKLFEHIRSELLTRNIISPSPVV